MSTTATVTPVEVLPGITMSMVVTKDDHLTVWAQFTGEGIDRPRTTGMTVKDMTMAHRLIRASLALKAVSDFKIMTDVNGKTYVDFNWKVLARMLNADLRRLGY